MRILHKMNRLLLDYCFPTFPLSFGQYRFNAGYLSEPLFELQTTLSLLRFFYSAEQIHTCGVRSFSKESQTSCGGIVARNNSLLCTHLSFATDEHFCSFCLQFALTGKLSLVCRWFQVVVRQPAPLSFEQQNTELLDVLSLTPYFKFAS